MNVQLETFTRSNGPDCQDIHGRLIAPPRSVGVTPLVHPKPAATGPLTDAEGRTQDYWRISITDRCNLRCIYCTPSGRFKSIPRDKLLTLDELVTLARIARDLGVRKIKITGGEPLIRRDVCELIRELVSLPGIEDVGITTNGILLSSMASELKAAGLKRVNVSCDTLNPAVYRHVTRRGNLKDVLTGIFAALEAGLTPVKINTVLLRGLNEPDVAELARLTVNLPIHVRYCEKVSCGPDASADAGGPFTATEALDLIRTKVGELEPISSDKLAGPARLFRIPNSVSAIGVVDVAAGHSCASCNRMRLTARGTLRPCLFDSTEVDIRAVLRSHASHDHIASIIGRAVATKRTVTDQKALSLESDMNLIGG